MADDDFSVILEPVENLHGGGSRTLHAILKRKHGTLAQSVFSCALRDKIAPNRDYPYEGICAVLNGDSWKFIDAIAVGIKIHGEPVPLIPGPVTVSPWACEYSYEAGEVTLTVTYYLSDSEGCLGYVRASLNKSTDASIIFEPYFDIRYMYGESRPAAHVADLSSGTLSVSVDGRTACLSLPGASLRESRHMLEWRYKLGSGDRREFEGQIRPEAESRRIVSFCEIESHGSEAVLCFSCGESKGKAIELMRQKMSDITGDVARGRRIRDALLPSYTGTWRERALVWRAVCMSKFGMLIDGVRFQEAGDFWFRSVWFRDQFEGLLNNYETIKRIGGAGCVRSILLESFKLQDDHGRIPNRYVSSGEKYDYNSADATLLAFMLAGKVVRDTDDSELARQSGEAFDKYLKGVSSGTMEKNGPPVVKPGGLLAIPAWHSWTDGFRMVEGKRMPIRMSAAWEEELIRRGLDDEVCFSQYLLPEINAQWLRCLEAGSLFGKYTHEYELADRCKMLYIKARGSFKPLFFNQHTGFVNNMATADESALGHRIDETIGSPGLVAASILGTDMFSGDELITIVHTVRERLLRHKWGMAFGVAVNDSGRCVYLNGEDYHEGVVWPRDTPYLIRLLSLAGETGLMDQLLASNLRHQMEEGFVFYNQELFSCDHDWTPVKDPVQWWSQWVDPYLTLLR